MIRARAFTRAVAVSVAGAAPTGTVEAGTLPSSSQSDRAQKGVEKIELAKKMEQTPRPFLLSEGLPPVPAKLVARIQRGDFIDMAELLRDNLEAQRRGTLPEQGSSAASSTHVRPRREVPDLLSWVQCFGLYTAVVASKYPERFLKLLAYQTLIVREARRCGGRGWLTYDCFFRQQMAGEWRGEEWGRLNPYLFASTFLALGASSRPNCSLCLESDHSEEECALARGKTPVPPKQPSPREHYREGYQRLPKGRSTRSLMCFAWNQGECTFQFCRFKHACTRCGGDHRILQCRAAGTLVDRRVVRERDVKGYGTGGGH